VRLFHGPQNLDERLLWSRDIRFVHRLAESVPGARVLELDSGTILIASAADLTDAVAAEIAAGVHGPQYGLATVDPRRPERERYLFALSEAVQASGLADRIGMARSMVAVQSKVLDYFFNLRAHHRVAFQPIVDLTTGEVYEYECLFRPEMPVMPQTISSIVQAAIDTDRSVELDAYLVGVVLGRVGQLQAAAAESGGPPLRVAINLTPASLLSPTFESNRLVERVRSNGLDPRQITLECTEQQSISDMLQLRRQVKALRRKGFGFAVDDAGAGYASFSLIAALRPSIIKIDRDIVSGISRDDARQALVEAFVSFGRRIGARLVAEGIERRVDLATLASLGVEFGQGFLLGRPAGEPGKPRRMMAMTHFEPPLDVRLGARALLDATTISRERFSID
jgi:EAL domain-containing protein (putative c-di-GMP-specific phosphodiesterase class I)